MVEQLLPQGTQALFPLKAERAYLNNASIAPMSLPVIAAVDAFMADVRDFGRNNYPDWCRRADTEVKERIGQLIGGRQVGDRVHQEYDRGAGHRGHKWLLAPIGTAIFYCRRDALDLLEPPTVGYHSVDKGEDHMDYDLTFRPNAGRFEEALVNFPGIWGLDAAVQLHLAVGSKKTEQHIGDLIHLAAEELQERDCEILSPRGHEEWSGILSFRDPRVPQR